MRQLDAELLIALNAVTAFVGSFAAAAAHAVIASRAAISSLIALTERSLLEPRAAAGSSSWSPSANTYPIGSSRPRRRRSRVAMPTTTWERCDT